MGCATITPMSFLESILLGIVEGATEFLPISSTGHLILASSILGIDQTEFTKTFEVAIQLGAILAVVVLHASSFLNIALLKKIAVASLPTGIIGFAFYSFVKAHLIGNELVVVIALLLGGIALIAFERIHEEKDGAKDLNTLSYRDALLIGLAQTTAMIPGVSRSAATILGGLALGVSRIAIVEFSFLLAVPVMVAATSLDLLHTGDSFAGRDWLLLAVGFAVSFVVALAAIRWLLAYVRSHSFVSFGIYRIILALAFLTFMYW